MQQHGLPWQADCRTCTAYSGTRHLQAIAGPGTQPTSCRPCTGPSSRTSCWSAFTISSSWKPGRGACYSPGSGTPTGHVWVPCHSTRRLWPRLSSLPRGLPSPDPWPVPSGPRRCCWQCLPPTSRRAPGGYGPQWPAAPVPSPLWAGPSYDPPWGHRAAWRPDCPRALPWPPWPSPSHSSLISLVAQLCCATSQPQHGCDYMTHAHADCQLVRRV